MFKFHVISAGRDMITDAGRAKRRPKIQNPMITNKSTKKEGPFENMGFNGKTV